MWIQPVETTHPLQGFASDWDAKALRGAGSLEHIGRASNQWQNVGESFGRTQPEAERQPTLQGGRGSNSAGTFPALGSPFPLDRG